MFVSFKSFTAGHKLSPTLPKVAALEGSSLRIVLVLVAYWTTTGNRTHCDATKS